MSSSSKELSPSEIAEFYMINAIDVIDSKFGYGFAEKNPMLLSGFMQTHATIKQTDMITSSLADMEYQITEHLAAINNIVSTL